MSYLFMARSEYSGAAGTVRLRHIAGRKGIFFGPCFSTAHGALDKWRIIAEMGRKWVGFGE